MAPGVVAVGKSRGRSPPALLVGEDAPALLPTTPVSAAPNTPIASWLNFGSLCILPRSALGCWPHLFIY